MKRTRTVFRVYPPGYELMDFYRVRRSRLQALKLAYKLGIGSTVMPYQRKRGEFEYYPTDHWWEIVDD